MSNLLNYIQLIKKESKKFHRTSFWGLLKYYSRWKNSFIDNDTISEIPWMNFDAEGFFQRNGLLYIFSKSDGSAVGYTKLYTIPDQPGTYTATLIDSFYTNDRITSADINSDISLPIVSLA